MGLLLNCYIVEFYSALNSFKRLKTKGIFNYQRIQSSNHPITRSFNHLFKH